MSQDNLKRVFAIKMTDAQANALIVYAYWKGLDGCDEAIRMMIDGATQYMAAKGVNVEDYADAINRHMSRDSTHPKEASGDGSKTT